MRFSIFLGIFFTAKKSIFNAKNENSEISENAENSHKNLTAMGSYSHHPRGDRAPAGRIRVRQRADRRAVPTIFGHF